MIEKLCLVITECTDTTQTKILFSIFVQGTTVLPVCTPPGLPYKSPLTSYRCTSQFLSVPHLLALINCHQLFTASPASRYFRSSLI